MIDGNCKPIFYIKLRKDLYRNINEALLFYEKLTRGLKAMGFITNSNDPCVANNMVNGKQFTVVWHADEITFSREDEKEVTKAIK